MNTPKSKAQQAIDAVKARLASGEITPERARQDIERINAEYNQAMYRALLDQAQQAPSGEPDREAFAADTPMVRPFVEMQRVSGRARVYEPAHLILIGALNTLGMLIAELHQRFTLTDVSAPEPHPRGWRVDADIAPHLYLSRPQGGPQ